MTSTTVTILSNSLCHSPSPSPSRACSSSPSPSHSHSHTISNFSLLDQNIPNTLNLTGSAEELNMGISPVGSIVIISKGGPSPSNDDGSFHDPIPGPDWKTEVHHHHHQQTGIIPRTPSPPRIQTPDLGSPFLISPTATISSNRHVHQSTILDSPHPNPVVTSANNVHLPTSSQPFPSLLKHQSIINQSDSNADSVLEQKDSSPMTPAQKMARQVRRSFSVVAPPTPNNSSSSLETTDQNIPLTPAQAVVHQVRLMASTEQTTTEKPKLKKPILKSDPKLSTEPPFRVISGRKGLPGDGNDKSAIIRSSDSSEKPAEPKLVKSGSTKSTLLQPHSAATTHPPVSTSPKATLFPGSPGTLPSVQIVEPSPSPVRPTTLNPLPPLSPTPPGPVPSNNSTTVIPLAKFPTYNPEEETDLTEEEEEDSEEEEEDYDSNPLYIVLSTSGSPRLKEAYNSAKLVLLPNRRALPVDMPRKLPDPDIEFGDEWEKWIAAHTFVGETDTSSSSSSSKGTVEWVGVCKDGDRRVNLSLKPGTGIAEVRLTIHRPTPLSTQLSANKLPLSSVAKNPPEPLSAPDFTPSTITSEFDPHRTIRSKAIELQQPTALSPPSTLSSDLNNSPAANNNRFSKLSSITTCSTVTRPSTSSSVPRSGILRSPSTATESSVAFTQASRTSSEAWSDLPVTPPQPLISEQSQQQPQQQQQQQLPQSVLAQPQTVETVTRVQFAKIISEETMYRSPPRSSASTLSASTPSTPATAAQNVVLESALSGSKAKKGKEVEQRLRFKAPKWLRPGAAQKEKERREKALALARERERERLRLLEGEGGRGLERVRLVSLKGSVIEPWWKTVVHHSLDDHGTALGEVPFPTRGPGSPVSCNCSMVSLSRRSTYSNSLRMTSCNHGSSTVGAGRRSSSKESGRKDAAAGGAVGISNCCECVASGASASATTASYRRRSRRMPSGLSVLRHYGVGGSSGRPRNLLSDLSFLLSPPEEFGKVGGVLRKWVGKIWSLSQRFNESFGYYKGSENYLLTQLKKDLFEPICKGLRQELRQNGDETIVRWVNEDWDRFGTLIENVLMAFLYPSLYTRGVATQFSGEDDYLDTILHNYRKREIALSEFEIDLPMGLQDESVLTEAIEKLNQLRPMDGLASSTSLLDPEVLQRLFVAMDISEEQTVLKVLTAKTPLESIGIIKQTIDSLVTTWTELATQAGMVEEARRLTPDDLLALLACVIVRSGVEQQHSMIHYAKIFKLGTALSPETDWAFVSYQAAIAYLQSDPFSAVDSRSVNSQPVSVSSLPCSPSLGPGWTRRRPASFTPRTRTVPNGHGLEGRAAISSSTLSSPSGSSIRISSTDPRAVPRPTRPVLEPPRHLAGKVQPTRPTLAPISTTDRCVRRSLDLGMLSAPMGTTDSRACSNGWESVRSLSSIGESEPSNSRPSGAGGPSRSFHFPHAGSGEFYPSHHHHSLSLERRKTSDWSDNVSSVAGGVVGGESRTEGWIEWGRKRLTSVASLQVMGSGGGGTIGTGIGGTLTPAMAALARAGAQSTSIKTEEDVLEGKEDQQPQQRQGVEPKQWRVVRPKSVIGIGSS